MDKAICQRYFTVGYWHFESGAPPSLSSTPLPSISASRLISRKTPTSDFISFQHGEENRNEKGFDYLSRRDLFRVRVQRGGGTIRNDTRSSVSTRVRHEFRKIFTPLRVRYSLHSHLFFFYFSPFLEGGGFTHSRSGRIYHVERILTSLSSSPFDER